MNLLQAPRQSNCPQRDAFFGKGQWRVAPRDVGRSELSRSPVVWKSHQIDNEKRACIDWAGHLPGGRLHVSNRQSSA
jgi:hypothetical protein